MTDAIPPHGAALRSARDHGAARLDLADTRGFTAAGAGPARRDRITSYLEEWLAGIWAQAVGPQVPTGLALASVGSLARRDAGPLSDLDLVLLHDPRVLSQRAVDALAERVWYPVWDAKVSLDHSVRTVAQCRAVASADLSAAVGLLDLRALAGDPELVAAAQSTIAHDWRANARTRLGQVREAVTVRHARFGEVAHLVEPDLKEARGGLRDMAVIRALAAAWLTDRPHGDVDTAYERLLDVRDAVHVITGRGRDRLNLADHDAVAAMLGYQDPDDLLTEVSGHARTLTYALDGTLRRASQSQRARTLRVGPRRPTLTSLGFGLYEHDGEVVLGPRTDPSADPFLLLRAALVAARQGVPLAPLTLTNLAAQCPDLSVPWPEEALGLFTELLAAGPGLVQVWEGLDLAGVIERWIPEWASVRSRPQRNPVHRHTVDRHLVETIVAAAPAAAEASRPDLLLLSALLHDIGKVRGAHDHSVEGAQRAREVLRRLGVAPADAEVVVMLVREHLTLIELATRRDPADPKTIAAVVAAVGGSREALDLLAALTEADAAATGPLAWSDWRATLFRRLLDQARRALPEPGGNLGTPALEDAHPAIPHAVRAGRTAVTVISAGSVHRLDIAAPDRLGLFADTAALLSASGFVVRSAVLRTVDGVAFDEWHVESPGGERPLARLVEAGLDRLAGGDRTPLNRLARASRRVAHSGGLNRAFVIPDASDTATVLEVRTADRPGLLHDVGSTLVSLGLDIRSAHIATYAGQAVDTFYVTDGSGAVLAPGAAAMAVGALLDMLDGGAPPGATGPFPAGG